MNDKISIKKASMLWNISERRISCLCKQGRIAGAVKEGRNWAIPAEAEKPLDLRIKNGAYQSKRANLPLPVGVSDYRIASKEYYYVDKTLFI